MALRIPMVVDQGTTFRAIIYVNDATGSPYSFAGFKAARAFIKRTYTSLTHTPFTVDISTPGQVGLSLTPDQTSAIDAGRYVYDVELEDAASQVIRLIEGVCTITPEVSRG